jgi:hypothetical protein
VERVGEGGERQGGEQEEVDQERRRRRSGSRRGRTRRRRGVYTALWPGPGAPGYGRAFSCAYLWGGE